MKLLGQALLGSLLAVIASLSFAHAAHEHRTAIPKDEVNVRAEQVVGFLIVGKRLPRSWEKRQLKDVSSRESPNGLIWVVTYQNPNESDKSKRMLYIFLDDLGNFIDNNYSGKL